MCSMFWTFSLKSCRLRGTPMLICRCSCFAVWSASAWSTATLTLRAMPMSPSACLRDPVSETIRPDFRFGKLGYDLVEKRGLYRYQPRTYMVFAGLVTPWTRHVATGRDLMRRSIDAATSFGDFTYAA